jgi:hypothetical protein
VVPVSVLFVVRIQVVVPVSVLFVVRIHVCGLG